MIAGRDGTEGILAREKGSCRKCKRALTLDEIGATKKLINRGTSVYFCLDCLAEAFDVSREEIQEKIRYFKEMGCTLFLSAEDR